MKNKKIAKRMIAAYINNAPIGFEERITEIALLTEDDERLLDHINEAIDIFTKAKKEIEDERKDNISTSNQAE